MTHRVRLRLLGNILRHPSAPFPSIPSIPFPRFDASSGDAVGGGATQREQRLFLEAGGNDGNLRAIPKLNPPSSLQPLPALHLSLPQFFRRSLFLSAH